MLASLPRNGELNFLAILDWRKLLKLAQLITETLLFVSLLEFPGRVLAGIKQCVSQRVHKLELIGVKSGRNAEYFRRKPFVTLLLTTCRLSPNENVTHRRSTRE